MATKEQPFFAYQAEIKKSDLTAHQKLILFTYSTFFNFQTNKSAFPSYTTLSNETGLSKNTIINNIKVLQELGWLVKTGKVQNLKGYTNAYRCTVPIITVLDTNNAATVPNLEVMDTNYDSEIGNKLLNKQYKDKQLKETIKRTIQIPAESKEDFNEKDFKASKFSWFFNNLFSLTKYSPVSGVLHKKESREI